MDATTIAVDLAKDVFEVVEATAAHRIVGRQRLTRGQFERYLARLRPGTTVVMEACGTAQYWARGCQARALRPVLLPVQYVRAYVRRNKSDRTDAEALLEAQRCDAMLPVPVKTAEQQSIQALHRIRQQWQKTRTARINALRGILREQGVAVAQGRAALRRVPALLDTAALPGYIQLAGTELLEEIRALEDRVARLDARLTVLAHTDASAQRLQSIPGIGIVTATALLGSVPHIHAFRRGRQFASWLGLTPREAASGHRRWRGRISKRGDVYLRTLLIHGARSVINNARRRAHQGGTPLTDLQRWAVTIADRRGANKAAAALANKIARVIWAVWRSDGVFTTWRSTPQGA
jgi:transposase